MLRLIGHAFWLERCLDVDDPDAESEGLGGSAGSKSSMRAWLSHLAQHIDWQLCGAPADKNLSAANRVCYIFIG